MDPHPSLNDVGHMLEEQQEHHRKICNTVHTPELSLFWGLGQQLKPPIQFSTRSAIPKAFPVESHL